MMTAAPLVLLVLTAQAVPPAADADIDADAEAKAKAQTLLKEGATLYERGALVQALEKFNEAYAVFKSPKLLFNIGQASRDLGRFAEAMTAFERFLDEAPDARPDMIEEAKKSVQELQGKLGKIRIQCSKTGAEISVDGKPVGVAPLTEPIWAMQGTHQVTARHQDMTPAVEDVDVNVGWVHTVVMNLQPSPDAVPRTVPVPVHEQSSKAVANLRGDVTGTSKEVSEMDGARRRVWTWVAAGAAVAFTGSAVGFGLAMKSKFDDLNNTCGDASLEKRGCSDSEIDGVLLRRNIANVSWGLAAAAAVTAGVLFFVEGHEVSVAPMAGETTGMVARLVY
jgi:hypothetical protein